MTTIEAQTLCSEADLLVNESEVCAAISRMAGEITAQLQDSNPIVISVMNGGLIFTGQLLTKLVFPLLLVDCDWKMVGLTRLDLMVIGGVHHQILTLRVVNIVI